MPPHLGTVRECCFLGKNIGTKTTASPLICSAKCVTLSVLEARHWPGNFRLWEDRYGLLSSCGYDGADWLRARGRRAETYRVEETMRRVIEAYGTEGQAFAIPNCVAVSFVTPNTKPLTIMKRVGYHGNDLERIEKLNALSRRICAEVPDPETAQHWLKETTAAVRSYAVWIYYLGNFMAAAGFCCVFGGTVRDWLWAGLSGLIIGFVTRCMDRMEVNPFFSTIAASFLMALPGVCRCRPRLARLCGGRHHRRADAARARTAHHKFDARHHLRRHELRRQPHRAGAALGVRHRAWHGGGVACYDPDLRTCGGGCGADLSALGAGSRDVCRLPWICDPV